MSSRSLLQFAAVLLTLVALVLIYFATVIGVSLVQANADARAVLSFGIYVLAALVAPSGFGVWLKKKRNLAASASLAAAAGLSIVGQALFIPIALAALAM